MAGSLQCFNKQHPLSAISTFTHLLIQDAVVVIVNVYPTCKMSNKAHAVSIFTLFVEQQAVGCV